MSLPLYGRVLNNHIYIHIVDIYIYIAYKHRFERKKEPPLNMLNRPHIVACRKRGALVRVIRHLLDISTVFLCFII